MAHRARATAGLLVLALSAAACSSGGSSGSGTTTAPGKALTPAQLSAALPPAGDVGTGFKLTPLEQVEPGEQALRNAGRLACPADFGISALTPKADEISRVYNTTAGDSLEVDLDPAWGTASPSALAKAAAAVTACKPIRYTVPASSGTQGVVSARVVVAHTYASQGIHITLRQRFTSGSTVTPVTVECDKWLQGTVGITVCASGTGATVPPKDLALMTTLAKTMQAKVKALEG